MAFETWHDYGYGVCISDVKIDSPERIGALIGLTKRFNKDVWEYFNEYEITEPTVDDYEKLIRDHYHGYGIANVLKRVIEEKEHIELSACGDFNGKRYLMFMPDYPWFTPWRYRFIPERKIEKVIRKYLSMLTDDDFKVEYLSVENAG